MGIYDIQSSLIIRPTSIRPNHWYKTHFFVIVFFHYKTHYHTKKGSKNCELNKVACQAFLPSFFRKQRCWSFESNVFDPLRRNNFTLAEKLEVFEFKRKNPKESNNKIAKIFTEKWDKPLNREHVRLFCRKIESEKRSNVEFGASDMTRRKLCPTKIREFEAELCKEINQKLNQNKKAMTMKWLSWCPWSLKS